MTVDRGLGVCRGAGVCRAQRRRSLRDVAWACCAVRARASPAGAVTAPARVAARSSLLHSRRGRLVGRRVLAWCADGCRVERHGAISAWIIDDTSFPAGAAFGRRGAAYCGQLGEQDNCQVAVSLSLAFRRRACRSPPAVSAAGVGVDRARRRKAAFPRSSRSPSRRSHSMSCVGLRGRAAARVVLLEPAMAISARCALTSRRWACLRGRHFVDDHGGAPGPAVAGEDVVGPRTRPKLCGARHASASLGQGAALSLPKRAWRTMHGGGAAEPLRSRFARLRVRAAHRDDWLAELRAEECCC